MYAKRMSQLMNWLVAPLCQFLLPLGDWEPLTHHWSNSVRQVSLGKILEASIVSPPRGMTLPLVISRSTHPGSASTCVAVHLASLISAFQRKQLVEPLNWSWIDCFWVFFGGELLGEAVIGWPCSFRGRNNTFRDFGSLGLWTFHAQCCKAQQYL